MRPEIRIACPSDGFVEGSRVVVSAQHPVAALAGVEIFAAGGNAVDAAVAAALASCVADVARTGLGGYGGHLVYHEAATGKSWLVNFPTRAPHAAYDGLFKALPGDPSDPESSGWWRTEGNKHQTGPLAVAVPAVVTGLAAAHSRFGKLPWADLLGPAIRAAEEGVQVSERNRGLLESERERLAQFPETVRAFLDSFEGDRLRQPELGRTLRLLAAEGPRVFYEGEIADRIVAHLRSLGGILDQEDLAGYRPELGEAYRSTYRRFTLYTPGPGCGADIVVPALQTLEGFDLPALEPLGAERLALIAEVLGRAWRDRLALSGDLPEGNPAAEMFSEGYAARMRAEILRGGKPPSAVPQPPGGTNHLSVADAEGNIVACTATTMKNLGSGVLVPGTGIVLNNGVGLFDPVPGRPNSLGAGKRSITNMCPTVVLEKGRPLLGIGASGGRRVESMILQALTLVLDHGWRPDEALAAPRLHYHGGPYFFLEDRYPKETLEGLAARGYSVAPREWGSPDLGGQAPLVWIDAAGKLFGAPEPRRTGAAAGL